MELNGIGVCSRKSGCNPGSRGDGDEDGGYQPHCARQLAARRDRPASDHVHASHAQLHFLIAAAYITILPLMMHKVSKILKQPKFMIKYDAHAELLHTATTASSLVAAFIVCCGVSHLVIALGVDEKLHSLALFMTACVSLTTACFLYIKSSPLFEMVAAMEVLPRGQAQRAAQEAAQQVQAQHKAAKEAAAAQQEATSKIMEQATELAEMMQKATRVFDDHHAARLHTHDAQIDVEAGRGSQTEAITREVTREVTAALRTQIHDGLNAMDSAMRASRDVTLGAIRQAVEVRAAHLPPVSPRSDPPQTAASAGARPARLREARSGPSEPGSNSSCPQPAVSRTTNMALHIERMRLLLARGVNRLERAKMTLLQLRQAVREGDEAEGTLSLVLVNIDIAQPCVARAH
jgi:hypothetical protein